MPDRNQPLELSQENRSHLRGLLERAFAASQRYDGSEEAENRLIAPLVLYDEFIRAQNNGTMSAELEAQVAEMAFPNHPSEMPLTVSEFLNKASEFYFKLKEAGSSGNLRSMLETSGAMVIDDPRVFVKTDDGRLREAQSANPEHYKVTTQPRLALLIEHLRNDGVKGQKIYMDDLVIRFGKTDPAMLREHPYAIVQIPRLNMEVAVCDEVGEVTFVKKGTVGPEFWDYMSKDALKQRDDVRAVAFHNEQRWWEGISDALSAHGEAGAKINVAQWIAHKPNLDIDLVKASLLDHREATGEWLSNSKKGPDGKRGSYILEHGPYAGQINVRGVDNALYIGLRGLPGASSISRLNAELSAEHGLDYVNPKDQDDLDVSRIKASLLAHREATGKWLTSHNKKGPDGKRGSYVLEHGPYAGQMTVSALDGVLSQGLRSLPGGSSIAQLNEEISAEHGLDYVNHLEQDDLDLELIKASLLAQRLYNGEWLTSHKKGADGKKGSYILEHGPYVGEITTGKLQGALYEGHRGLPGHSGISDLNKQISDEYRLDYLNHLEQDNLDLDLIKQSLLAHRLATGEWLSANKKKGEDGKKGSYILEHGPYAGQIAAGALNNSLDKGLRGLTGSSSIALLNEEISAEHGLDYVNRTRPRTRSEGPDPALDPQP